MEEKVLSCEFNMDTGCVEIKYADGSIISINCAKVENEVARNMYEISELDWLIYNAPMDYVNLLLHRDIREYLNNVTDYHPLDIWSVVKTPGLAGGFDFIHLQLKRHLFLSNREDIQNHPGLRPIVFQVRYPLRASLCPRHRSSRNVCKCIS